MGRKKFFKKWRPDPKIASLLKPFFDRGFPAYIAAEMLLRDNNGVVVKNPNVKTYFKYWNFWKDQALEEQRQKYFQLMQKTQQEYEEKYLAEYDKLILVTYEMEQTLESSRKFKKTDLFEYENYNSSSHYIDLKLEKLIMRVTKLWSDILLSKYNMENDIILYKINKKKFDRNLSKIKFKTHRMLIRVVSFLAKQNARKAVLDCQIKTAQSDVIVIKCGICAAQQYILQISR